MIEHRQTREQAKNALVVKCACGEASGRTKLAPCAAIKAERPIRAATGRCGRSIDVSAGVNTSEHVSGYHSIYGVSAVLVEV